jgi:hypothetical protein
MTCHLSPAAQQRGVYAAGYHGIHNGSRRHKVGPISRLHNRALCASCIQCGHNRGPPVGRAERRHFRRMAGASFRAGRRAVTFLAAVGLTSPQLLPSRGGAACQDKKFWDRNRPCEGGEYETRRAWYASSLLRTLPTRGSTGCASIAGAS